jgi:delta14-sterol reductase
MDITTDGFGFMLVFGDLVWVPFTYTIQARYLAIHPQDLSAGYLGFIVLLNLFGLYIFRSSNSEKDAFRTNPDDPKVKHLKYMTTKTKRKLLISGWWGTARKINYTGDWLMSVAWCLPCGFGSIIPYFYCIYFAGLLIHRADRDNHICSAKYGEDWKQYCQKVPYKFIPYVF